MYVENLFITNLYDYLSNTGHDQIKIAAYKVPSGLIAREKSAELAGYSAEFFVGEGQLPTTYAKALKWGLVTIR